MSLVLLFLLLNIFFNHGHCLKLKFVTSKTLTDQIIYFYKRDFNLPRFVMSMMENEEFWPVLLKFNEARYFNFQSILKSVFKVKSKEIAVILNKPNFPLSELVSAEVLNDCTSCSSRLSNETLLKAQNPLSNMNFNSLLWSNLHLKLFLKAGYYQAAVESNGMNIDWNHICIITNGFDGIIDTDEFSFLNNVINCACTSIIPKDALMNSFSMMANELTVLFPGRNKILFPRFNQDQIDFNLLLIMRIVSIAAISISHRSDSDLIERGQDILREFLVNHAKEMNNSFPLCKNLLFLINSFLVSGNSIETYQKITEILLELIEFCQGKVRATWLINVFMLWNHFLVSKQKIDNFLDPFLDIFFLPESRASSSDVELVLFYIRGIPCIQDSTHAYQILSKYFKLRPDLAEQFYNNYFYRIPNNIKKNNELFPLEMRLSYIFKNLRLVENFYPSNFINIDFDDWIELIDELGTYYDSNNFHAIPIIIGNYKKKSVNLESLLRAFFYSLLKSEWWVIKSKRASNEDPRPVIIPSIYLPPQIIEVFGFVLANALRIGLRVPFVIDFKYFDLEFVGLSYATLPTLINLFHPNFLELKSSVQISRIARTLDMPRDDLYFQEDLGGFWLLPQVDEPQMIYNSNDVIFNVLLQGSRLLKKGVARLMPIKALNSANLHELLFK